MAVTTNLSLDLLDAGDLAARTKFNGNMNTIDGLGAALAGDAFTTIAGGTGTGSKGDLINLTNSGGAIRARSANASVASLARIAHGVALANYTTGGSLRVKTSAGVIEKTAHGFTIGALLYLSGSADGAWTATAPSTSGYAVQPVGVATTANEILWFGVGTPYIA